MISHVWLSMSSPLALVRTTLTIHLLHLPIFLSGVHTFLDYTQQDAAGRSRQREKKTPNVWGNQPMSMILVGDAKHHQSK
jgi:hypothetical protein